jgi:hypothetical protein
MVTYMMPPMTAMIAPMPKMASEISTVPGTTPAKVMSQLRRATPCKPLTIMPMEVEEHAKAENIGLPFCPLLEFEFLAEDERDDIVGEAHEGKVSCR